MLEIILIISILVGLLMLFLGRSTATNLIGAVIVLVSVIVTALT